jgi:hypothetical protein
VKLKIGIFFKSANYFPFFYLLPARDPTSIYLCSSRCYADHIPSTCLSGDGNVASMAHTIPSLNQMRETWGRIVFNAFYLLRYMWVARKLISARPYLFLTRLLLRGNSFIHGLKFRGIRQCTKGKALLSMPANEQICVGKLRTMDFSSNARSTTNRIVSNFTELFAI